jgi:hypothetical protein
MADRLDLVQKQNGTPPRPLQDQSAAEKKGQAPQRRMMTGFRPGLVATARAKHPIPSRTQTLGAVAPMVLRIKTRESRSPTVLTGNPGNVSLKTLSG